MKITITDGYSLANSTVIPNYSVTVNNDGALMLNNNSTSLIPQYLGLSSDRLAALVLARRALRKKERIPTNYARVGAEHVLPLQVDSSRHVWSFWNALSKKLKGVKCHSFFSVPNRKVEVKRLDELLCNRFNGKSLDTSITRRDSLSRVVNNSARLTQK
jgi:hypothetical protein